MENKEYIEYVEQLDGLLNKKQEFESNNGPMLNEYDSIKKDIEIVKNCMKVLGNNTYEFNNRIYDTKMRNTSRLNTKLLKKDMPELVAKYTVKKESPIVYVKEIKE